jgi:hypothetical protein
MRSGTHLKINGIQSARLSIQTFELAPPRPFTRKRILPTPLHWVQGGDTLACREGVGGGPNSDDVIDTLIL